jgi:F-type H+-transporting ATPase subunit epsilon
MNKALHLTVTTPAQVLVAVDDVVAVRVEDQSGSFGVLPGHADILTVLVPSVVRWRVAGGVERFCAVRSGVFAVSEGRNVAVACREGVLGDSLDELEAKVHVVRARELESDRKVRVEQVRLHALAVRQLVRYLRPSPALAPASIEREAVS